MRKIGMGKDKEEKIRERQRKGRRGGEEKKREGGKKGEREERRMGKDGVVKERKRGGKRKERGNEKERERGEKPRKIILYNNNRIRWGKVRMKEWSTYAEKTTMSGVQICAFGPVLKLSLVIPPCKSGSHVRYSSLQFCQRTNTDLPEVRSMLLA